MLTVRLLIVAALSIVRYRPLFGQLCTSSFQKDITQGFRILQTPLKEIRGIGLVKCMKVCQEHSLCKGVNFNIREFDCQLMTDDQPTSADNDFIFATTISWSLVNLSGRCFNHSCPGNSKCIVTERGEKECIIIGCVGAPSTPGVNQTSFLSKPLWSSGDIVTSACVYNGSETTTCYANGTWSFYICEEVPPRDCAEAASMNKTINNDTLLTIDVDGNGPLPKAEVICEVTPTRIITIIEHDAMNRTKIDGYEDIFSYRLDLHYTMDLQQVIVLADASTNCEQYFKYDCFAVQIKKCAFWSNRHNETLKYFDGSGSDEHVCGCYRQGTCSNVTGNHKCNCDNNDWGWRQDVGIITNKTDLPMIHFWACDTGYYLETAYVTLGPLRCWK